MKNKIILFFLLLPLCITQSVLAQEDADNSKEKIISAVEITGNKNISTANILSKIKIRIGTPYKRSIVAEDIKRLYALGFFSDVSVELEDYEDGYKIIFRVVEKPTIEKLTIEGERYLRENRIKEMMQSKEGQPLDESQLKKDLEEIKRNYEKRGFSLLNINYAIDIDKETSRAKVKISISEGRRLKIRKIEIEGNDSFADKRIIKLIKTRWAWFFNPGFLKEDVLEEDLGRIQDFYRREGFNDVKVSKKVETHAETGSIYITFYIEEGKKYLVGNITLEGMEDFSEDAIRDVLKSSSGVTFTNELLQQDIANIQSFYFDKGYIFAQVKESTFLNPETDRVDITYTISENEVAYVDRINIRGNIKTKDVVIRRELRINPGDKFDGTKLKRSKERLYNLGFFEEVNYDIEPTDEPDKRNLVVDVKEAKTGEFSFGGGYSTIDEFLGFIEISQRNFDFKNFPYFTGDGQDLRIKAEVGTVSRDLDLSFTEPWIFDYPLAFGFDVYRRSHDRERDVGYGYNEVRKGGDLRLGKELSEYVKGNLTYRNENIEISDIEEDAGSELRKEEGENTISSLEFGLTQDKRDNIFNPTRGTLLSLSLETAGSFLGGDKDFLKLFTRSSAYVPLFNNSVLEFRLRTGLADAISDSTELPIYERFFAGGTYTIRGYNERKVGPIDSVTEDPLGGEALLVGNIEYTYPLVEFIKLATFFDSGNVWSKVDDFGSGGFKSSVGLGLRIKTPIGPINLDYGFPLNLEPGEEKKEGKFHFSFSRGF